MPHQQREPMVHPDAIEYVYFDENPEHNAIWDMAVSAEGPSSRRSGYGRAGGLVFIGLCNEGLPGLSAQLYVYDIKQKKLRRVFGVDEVTHDDTSDGHIPQSKFHTAMGIGKDGRLYAPTHTAAPGYGYEFSDIDQVYYDRRRAYPGSHYLVYDPHSDSVEDRGIPVPYESIYGGILDVERGVHYLRTYIHGRLFAYEISTGRVRDLGRVGRAEQFAIFKDREGRVFGNEEDGHLWRYDPDRDEVQFLSVKMPCPREREHLRMSLSNGTWGPDGKYYATALREGRLFSYDPFDGKEGKFEDLGMGWGDYFPDQLYQSTMRIPITAPDGCVYYCMATGTRTLLPGPLPYDLRIIRYDPKARTKENSGVIYHNGTSSLIFGSGVLGTDGRIYWGDSCSELHAARLVIFDPAKARKVGSLGPIISLSPRQSRGPTLQSISIEEKQKRSANFSIDESRVELVRIYRDVLPAGECALTTLAASEDMVFAAASGRSCHILKIDTDQNGVSRVTVSSSIQQCGTIPALMLEGKTVWAAFSPAGTQAREGTALLAIPVEGGEIETLNLPKNARGVVNMVRAAPDCFVVLSKNGVLLAFDPKKRTFCELYALEERKVSPALAVDGAGRVWGAVEEGFLYRIDVTSRSVEVLQTRIPSSRGSEYAAVWQSSAGGYGRPIYGGTREGFVFTLDTETGTAKNLGKPALAPEIRCMALARDKALFGIAGEQGGLARLFRYSPADGFTDLGRFVLGEAIRVVWSGHAFACAACAPDGRIWLGEDDTQAHLWVYQP